MMTKTSEVVYLDAATLARMPKRELQAAVV
jgi:hypothetical protein